MFFNTRIKDFKRMNEAITILSSKEYWIYLAWKIILFAFVYLNLWIFTGDHALPPNGEIFHISMIFLLAHFAGKVTWVFNLPDLVGMLIAGFVYGNALNTQFETYITSNIRSMALMVILVRAGLNLDPKAVKKLSWLLARITILPCLAETFAVALFAHLWFDMNFAWSTMLGFLLSGVSPAVIVPGMIKVVKTGYDIKKGIPSLLIACSSFDDALSVVGFTVALGFAYTKPDSDSTWNMIKEFLNAPYEILLGVGYGVLTGLIGWYVPEVCGSLKTQYQKKYNLHRFALLMMAGMFGIFGLQSLGYHSSGPLAVLLLGFVASLRWRPHGFHLYNEKCMKIVWHPLQHLLFALIAAEVKIYDLEVNVLEYGILTIIFGVIARTIVTLLITYGKNFTFKERLFCSIALFPKATVQAAIGAMALAAAKTDEDLKQGKIVLELAVISILIFAPVGAVLIEVLHPYLLPKASLDDEESQAIADEILQFSGGH